MNGADVIQRLREIGFEVAPASPDRIRWKWHGSGNLPAAETRGLLVQLEARKPEALAVLRAEIDDQGPAAWDEDRANHELEEAFRWADRISPPGCWRWLLDHDRTHHQGALDVAYDSIDDAFNLQDLVALEVGLNRFRCVVRAAIDEYKVRPRVLGRSPHPPQLEAL